MNHETETPAELCPQLFKGAGWAISRATEDARDGVSVCPYKRHTAEYDIWMKVRFGKRSVQEEVLKKIPNNIEYRVMFENQKPKCKRPKRHWAAKQAARIYMQGLK